MPLLWISLAFLAGLVLGDLTPANQTNWWVASGVALAAWLTLRFLPLASRFGRLQWLTHTHPYLKIAPGLLVVFCLLGAVRMTGTGPDLQNGHIAAWNDRGTVSIQAVVVSPPDPRDKTTLLRVRVESVTPQEAVGVFEPAQPAHGLVQVLLPAGSEWQYGDRLLLTGKPVDPPENDEFSYREYLARQMVYTYLSYPRVSLVAHNAGDPLLAWIYRFRDWAHKEIYRLYPSPEAPLLAGILLGIETGIPPDVARAFQDTGTSHVIAISGFNIAILAELFAKLFGKVLSRWWATLAAILAITCYTIMVGAAPSVVRAAIMGCLTLIATQIGRRATAYNSLGLSAGIMALFNPYLPWDAGFQLSFAATLGLIVFGNRWQDSFANLLARRIPATTAKSVAGPVGEYFLTTLAAQVVTLPIILYHFGRLSLSAMITNPLILPVQPLLMTLSGSAVLAGLIADPLAHLLAWLSWPLPAYTIRVVEALARLPGGVLALGDMNLGMVILSYAAIFLPVLSQRFRRAWQAFFRPGLALTVLALLTVFVWRGALTRPDGRLHLTVLDIDNSQVLLVQGPGGENVLLNGGPSSRQLADALGRRLSPFNRRLDAIVLNSPRAADLAALTDILENYPAQMTLWGCPPQTRAADRLVEALKKQEINIHALEAGEALSIQDDIRLTVLAVSKSGSALLLRWDNFRVLIPSGASPAELETTDLANLSLVLLTERDLQKTNQEVWLELAPMATIYTPGAGEMLLSGYNWLNTRPGEWYHITSDGKLMWVEKKQ